MNVNEAFWFILRIDNKNRRNTFGVDQLNHFSRQHLSNNRCWIFRHNVINDFGGHIDVKIATQISICHDAR